MNIYFFTWVLFMISFGVLHHLSAQEMKEEPTPPEYLYKIISKEAWQESSLRNQVVMSSMDKDFIHLAKEDQVAHVAQKFWKEKEYVILKISSNELIGRLLYETNPGGTTKYYHLYEGNIPFEAIKEVTIVPYTTQLK